jgi:hypothetical protein
MAPDEKVRLVLMRGDKALTAEGVAAFYKALTGRDVSPEKLAELRARLREGDS